MKILLLGKNGLLGREIGSVFKHTGVYDMYSLGREDLDITDPDAVYRIVKDVRPDVVINAAAFTFVDDCEAKKQFAMTVNGEANGTLAKICNNLGAYLIYFSTDYVFEGENENGYKEDDATSPINVYGESKLLGEQLIQKNTDNYYIFRTSWLFGMHGINFVKTMLDLAQDKDEIQVVNDQFGKPTYTFDLARGINDFLQNNQGKSGIYHLVNEGTTSWFDFAKKIFEFEKITVQLTPMSSSDLNRPARRPHISTLLNTKLPHLRSHEEALKDYLLKLKL